LQLWTSLLFIIVDSIMYTTITYSIKESIFIFIKIVGNMFKLEWNTLILNYLIILLILQQ